MKKEKELKTERLTLKPFSERDRERAIFLFKNEKISETYMLPVLDTEEKSGALFEKMVGMSSSDEYFCYGIYLGDVLIGWLNECGGDGTEVEIGYVIDPAYQGHGYATEAFGKAIEELFRQGFERVTAGYFEGNDASRRVMKKCGLVSIDKTEYIEYRGAKRKCHYMAIEKQWTSKKNAWGTCS